MPYSAPIDTFQASQLVRMAKWIESDGVLRTEDELLTDMMRELGFHRRGKKIIEALTAAIKRARDA